MEMEREVIELELKYCERCGGLWLRRKGNVEVFCQRCNGKMATAPKLELACTRPRLPVNRSLEIVGHEQSRSGGRGGEA
jgi:Zn-finger nucleic acid-binding protein